MRESLKKAEGSAGLLDPGSQQISPWRKDVNDRAGKKLDVRTRKERVYSAATLIQVRGDQPSPPQQLRLETHRLAGSTMSNLRDLMTLYGVCRRV